MGAPPRSSAFYGAAARADRSLYSVRSSRFATSSDQSTHTDRDSLELLLVLPSRIRSGAPVPISLRVSNRASRTIDMYLFGREPTLDVIVENSRGETVWRRLHGEIIPAILNIRSLAPAETIEVPASWDQTDNSDRQVEPGIYSARGEL